MYSDYLLYVPYHEEILFDSYLNAIMILVSQKNTSQMAIEMPDRGKVRLDCHGSREQNAPGSENLEKITHDIRSSINIIIGYTQLMLDQTTGKINAQQRQALQDILKSSNRLNELADIITKRLDAVSGKK